MSLELAKVFAILINCIFASTAMGSIIQDVNR